MNIANKLTNLISEKDIKQKQLAEVLNVAPSTINGYLTKGREPDIEMLIKLATFFDVTVDYLLDYEKEFSAGRELGENENELISLFRRLKTCQQEYLLDQIKFMIQQNYKRP